jgi:ATP-dependent RNA helicase RhlE
LQSKNDFFFFCFPSSLTVLRHSLFFSATLEPTVVALAHTLVRNPVHITVTPEQPTVERISQVIHFVEKDKKGDLLVHLLRDPKVAKVIVFTQMKHQANKVVAQLVKAGIPAVAIHGNKSQSARLQALAGFKANTVRVLAATDIAARGLDIDGVSHVVNYDLPNVVRFRCFTIEAYWCC